MTDPRPAPYPADTRAKARNGSSMGTMSYREQLLHPKWQRKRLGVLNRDGWACQRCQSGDKTLQVHHKRYVSGRMAWDYDDADLVTLCAECHELTHEEREALLAEIAAVWCRQSELIEVVRGYRSFPLDAPPPGSSVQFLAGVAAARTMLLGEDDARRVLALAERLFRIDAGLRVDQDA